MTRLTIVVEVDQDPTLVDPHHVAELLIDVYEDERGGVVGWYPTVTFVSAEWQAD